MKLGSLASSATLKALQWLPPDLRIGNKRLSEEELEIIFCTFRINEQLDIRRVFQSHFLKIKFNNKYQ